VGTSGALSAWSSIQSFTTKPAQFTFTDDPLSVQVTPVKAVNISQLRTAINTLLAQFGLAAFAFTDSPLTSTTPVRAVHLTELRTALAQVYQAAPHPAAIYSEPIITPDQTTIKASQIGELRAAVEALN
jgi:hypothetical protein